MKKNTRLAIMLEGILIIMFAATALIKGVLSLQASNPIMAAIMLLFAFNALSLWFLLAVWHKLGDLMGA